MFPLSEAGEEGTLSFREAVATLPGEKRNEVALCRLCTAVVNHSRQKQSGLSRMRESASFEVETVVVFMVVTIEI